MVLNKQREKKDEENGIWRTNLNFGFHCKLLDRPQSESSEFLDDVIRDLRSVATAGYRENIRAIVFKVKVVFFWEMCYPTIGFGIVGLDWIAQSKFLTSALYIFDTIFQDIEKGSFGFSVSDGVVDKGVFIHSVKPDGPASRAGVHPYDRILQINNTRFVSIKFANCTCNLSLFLQMQRHAISSCTAIDRQVREPPPSPSFPQPGGFLPSPTRLAQLMAWIAIHWSLT